MKWYAIYTHPRAEKRAHAQLLEKGIETYLPLLRTLRQWSDRKKWVEVPLFRSYLFVYITPKEHFEVLQTPGVVRYITFEGRAVPVPQNQIDAIRFYLTGASPEEPPDAASLVPGQKVEIIRGPLSGLTGQMIGHKGQQRVRIQIDALGQFLNLTIPAGDLKIQKTIERG